MAESTTIERKTEVRTDDHNDAKPYLVAHRLLDFLLFIIEGFLLLRFIFQLAGANLVGFVRFIYGISEIFMMPFRFIFPTSAAGEVVIEWSVLVAMIIYALIFYAIRKGIEVVYTADKE